MRTKCYSVRVESMRKISDKAYAVRSFDGSEDIIPVSQVFGPDYDDPKMEAKKKVPSWRRICKVLLKNDYWCKGLSFAQTKRELEKQVAMITRYNEEL